MRTFFLDALEVDVLKVLEVLEMVEVLEVIVGMGVRDILKSRQLSNQ